MFTTNLRYLIGIAVFVSLLGIARGQGADLSSAKQEIPSEAVADWISAASGSNFDGGLAEDIDVFSTILAEDLHAFFGSSAKH